MTTLRMPSTARPGHAGGDTKPPPAVRQDAPNGHLLEGELLDLYVAIVIVVPLALFLKSLLF